MKKMIFILLNFFFNKMSELGIPYTTVTPLAQVHEALATQGFAIIDEYRLSDEICAECKEEVWTALESLIVGPEDKKIRRDDVSTYKNYFSLGQLHSMMLQYFGFGMMPSAWKLRELAAPIFARIWDVQPNQLISSIDALSFHIAPENFEPPRGQYKGRNWWHTDQSLLIQQGKCLQGLYNLEECGPNDGCLSVLEGSHRYHGELRGRYHVGEDDANFKENWYLINDQEKQFFAEKGCRWRFVCPPKGAFVVWDSRTIHMGTEPRIPRSEPRDRLVYYICMLPRMAKKVGGYECVGIRDRDVVKKVGAFEGQRTTTHWPYPVKLFPRRPRFFSQEVVINPELIPRMRMEDMTPLQKKLLGM